ncbi:ion channel protein [Leifsonia sp. NPDC058194]|uniref:ion channel protein n=1 Tax=Leifsonia sp. NPDC058194 TaxID=3346374 RepID=UPI0036D8A66A
MSAAGPARPMPAPTVRTLLLLSIPALLIGVLSALSLWLLDSIAGLLEDAVWTALPSAIGVDGASGWWIFLVLTVTGAAVGLTVWLLPGHGGPDSATTELVTAPLPPAVVPSLALTAVLGLAGGVSLGPENPIIAINASVLVALVARVWKKVPTELVLLMAASATIGAMFGTPVAAALVFTGIVAAAPGGGALWDRLFLPLVAAAAGSETMTLLAHPQFGVPMPAYTDVHWPDVIAAFVIATAAALLGVAGATVFPTVHRAFHSLRNPLLVSLAGGAVLGLLGVIGGPITLFKGLEQMGQLIHDRAEYTTLQLVVIVLVKVGALLVAASAGFRGGRVFPAVFIGAAIGLIATSLVPGIPLPVAIASGVLGMTVAVARDGWIAIFVALAVTQSVAVLPIMCLAVLPAWLVVTRSPQWLIRSRADADGLATPALKPTA